MLLLRIIELVVQCGREDFAELCADHGDSGEKLLAYAGHGVAVGHEALLQVWQLVIEHFARVRQKLPQGLLPSKDRHLFAHAVANVADGIVRLWADACQPVASQPSMLAMEMQAMPRRELLMPHQCSHKQRDGLAYDGKAAATI